MRVFDLEYKIKWEELAPSLQNKFLKEVADRKAGDEEIWGNKTWYQDTSIKQQKNIYQIWLDLDKKTKELEELKKLVDMNMENELGVQKRDDETYKNYFGNHKKEFRNILGL